MNGLRNRINDFSWRIEEQQADLVIEGEEISAAPDLLPVPTLEQGGPRSWGWFHLMGYWVAEAFGISQYQVASSSVAAGLAPGVTIAAVVLGHFIISIPNALNGWVGSHHGLNFPVFAASSFGSRGILLAITCRCVAAIIWFGTQTYQGGQCIEVMLGAIWPSFRNFPNHLPASASVTSSQLLCFFIFYLIQLPLLWIHISKLRYLFLAKVIIMPIFGITLFAWSVKEAGGFGPVWSKGTHIKASDGRPAVVVFFAAMTSAIAPKATLALNIADFTRFAKRDKDVVWTNIFSLTILVSLCASLGVVVTSAAEVIYGVSTWNPLQVSNLMGNRAARFFSAFCWSLAVLATNISANSTAVGNDLAALFPRYVTIRRGQYICAILGLASCPWIIQSKATTFTAFLGGYSIFLGPVCGVMIADFWIVKRRKLHVAAIYRPGAESEYWFTHGWNFRAVAAFTLGCIPNLPGFIRSVGGPSIKASIPVGATYVFSVVWPLGFLVTGALYVLFCTIFPLPTAPAASVDRENESSVGIESKSIEASASDDEKKF